MITIMNDFSALHFMVLLVSGIILFGLLYFLFKQSGSANRYSRVQNSENGDNSEKTKPCPLCGTPLKPGEKVHSVMYPGKPDSLMEIFGCPYCEKPDSRQTRICPVCKKEMEAESVLIARVFSKPGKTHVHVLGCSQCYSGATKIRKKPAS